MSNPTITIRLEREEKRALYAAAKKAGKTVSEQARSCLSVLWTPLFGKKGHNGKAKTNDAPPVGNAGSTGRKTRWSGGRPVGDGKTLRATPRRDRSVRLPDAVATGVVARRGHAQLASKAVVSKADGGRPPLAAKRPGRKPTAAASAAARSAGVPPAAAPRATHAHATDPDPDGAAARAHFAAGRRLDAAAIRPASQADGSRAANPGLHQTGPEPAH